MTTTKNNAIEIRISAQSGDERKNREDDEREHRRRERRRDKCAGLSRQHLQQPQPKDREEREIEKCWIESHIERQRAEWQQHRDRDHRVQRQLDARQNNSCDNEPGDNCKRNERMHERDQRAARERDENSKCERANPNAHAVIRQMDFHFQKLLPQRHKEITNRLYAKHLHLRQVQV
ncbi:MAG: hypothetical protein HY257_01050 [Chloroflexi bacterium]|nr:hypothetical protein [Chloroflexota bacterium]